MSLFTHCVNRLKPTRLGVRRTAQATLLTTVATTASCLTVTLPSTALAQHATTLPAVDGAPLPTHDGFTVGTLDNGLTYMIKEHTTPPGWVAVRLLVTSGSLNEDEDQRGLAHFFEHLAFNGSEHFPPGSLIPTFEDMGVEFGRNLNASTGFDRTLYLVNLPKNDDATLETGLTWASDVAFRISLTPNEIDKERGVITEEWRTGRGAGERIREKMWGSMMPGAKLPARWPIGIIDVINAADSERLQRYYDRWYRPNKMTLMIVGDVNAEAILPTIEKLFNVPTRDGGTNAPDRSAEITPYADQKSIVVTDPEFVGCDVDLVYLSEGLPGVTTVETFREQQVNTIASFIFTRRLDNMIQEGGMPFRQASADISPVFRQFTYSSVSASGEPNDWAPSLEIISQEVNRIHQFGAVDSELERAKNAILAGVRQFAAREDTFPSQALAGYAIGVVNNGDTLMSAAQTADVLEDIFPTITLADINASLQKYFDPSRIAFTLTLPENDDVHAPTDEAFLAVATAALAIPVQPYTEEAAVAALMTDAPKAGATVSETTDDELQITTTMFANNVVMHYMHNDLYENTVSVTINIEGGEIEETEETRGLTAAAVAAWNQSATSTLTSPQINDLMSDKNTNVSVSGGSRDSVQLTISGLPDDLEFGLQLAHLLLTDPIVEPSAHANWSNGLLEQINARRFDPSAQLRASLASARTDDIRYAMITEANVKANTIERTTAWMQHLIASNPIEVTVVGDVEFTDMKSLIAQYVGSLSNKETVGSVAQPLRNLKVHQGPQHIKTTFVSKEPLSMGFICFRGADSADVKEKRLLEVAASILSTRLNREIREERGIVYSIGAVSVPSDVFPDVGLFYAASQCAPENAQQLVDVGMDEFAKFAQDGPSGDEVQTALAQITSNLSQAVQDPGYWVNGLSHIGIRSNSMDELRDHLQFFEEEVTSQDIHDAFKKYFVEDRMITVQVLPISEEEAAAADDGHSG